MRRPAAVLLSLMLVLAACGPSAAPPPPSQANAVTPFVIVTLPPEVMPTNTPAPAFDVGPYRGMWQIDFRFQFDGGEVIQQTRFVGGVPVEVLDDATFSGQGSLITSVRHEGCTAAVADDGEIRVTLTGEIRPGETGLEMVFDLRPDDPERVEHYRLQCPDFSEPLEFERQTLWPALEALDIQPFVLPLTPGASFQSTDDVSAATGGTLQGTLTAEIRLRR